MTTDESTESATAAGSVTASLEALMWDIYLHVREQGAPVFEAGIDPVQAEALRELAASTGAKRIAEIGFNVGFSSLAFLESAPDTTVVSFELNQRRAVQLAKSFIDARYPGRHELVIGDSRETLPPYTDNHPHTFDLVFVDGGHTHDIAASDIRHACRLPPGPPRHPGDRRRHHPLVPLGRRPARSLDRSHHHRPPETLGTPPGRPPRH